MNKKRKQTPLAVRFRRHYLVDELTSCWKWTGTLSGSGYGTIGLGAREDGKDLAHRVSWRLHRGDIPSGLFVLHRCDNKQCVNPDHLFLGTQQDNLDDAKSKGRLRGGPNGPAWGTEKQITGICKGEQHGRRKLNIAQVAEIRRLFDSGLNKAQLSRKFGVSRAMVRFIVTGKNWKHIVA